MSMMHKNDLKSVSIGLDKANCDHTLHNHRYRLYLF